MDPQKQAEVNALWAKILVEELVRLGVERFCIAPGGQSTALAIAASENPQAQTHVHLDERGLAFFALGQGKASGKPSAVICTSGTAVANLYPAVVEASHAREPLLLLTADLDWEKSDSGYNQSIDQRNFFSDFARWSFDFPAPEPDFSWQSLCSVLDQAVAKTLGDTPGPVHLNCRFKHPLVSEFGPLINTEKEFSTWKNSKTPFTSYCQSKASPGAKDFSSVVSKLSEADSGVIVVGQLLPRMNKRLILEAAAKISWPVITDPLSGLSLLNESVEGAVSSSKVAIYGSHEEFQKQHKPDLVLHLGGDILLRLPYEPFKRGVHRYLAKPQKGYFMVNEHGSRQDPFGNCSERVVCSIEEFCKSLIDSARAFRGSNLIEPIKEADRRITSAINELEESQTKLSEPFAVKKVLDSMPTCSALFLANSLSIRQADYLLTPDCKDILVGSPHGVKGIDGTIAEASGFCSALNRPTTLIIGDMAAFHDLNSLILASGSQYPFVIVVLNNDGGQIFSYVDASKTEQFEQCFTAPHGLNFDNVCRQFNINYCCPEDLEQLASLYSEAIMRPGASLIEVKTSRESLLETQQEIFDKAQDALTLFN